MACFCGTGAAQGGSGLRLDKKMRSGVEERLARVEGILEQIDKRFARMEVELSELRAEMARLSEKIDRNFRWTVGILLSALLPMWVGILALLLRR